MIIQIMRIPPARSKYCNLDSFILYVVVSVSVALSTEIVNYIQIGVK